MKITTRTIVHTTLIAGLLCFLHGCGYSTPHPTDNDLRARFLHSRAKFDELAILFQSNPQILAIGRGGGAILDGAHEREIRAEGEWDYTEEPVRHMATLLRDLHIDWGFQHCINTPNQWMLFVNCKGLQPSTTCKGYIFSIDPLRPQLASLDGGRPSSLDRYDRAYVGLEGKWLLLYEVWPGSAGRCLPRNHPHDSKP